MQRNRSVSALISAALVAAVSCGILISCSSSNDTRAGKAPIDAHDRVAMNLHPALRGTIGEFALFADSAPMQVEGLAIVAELPGSGSSDMPPAVHDKLLEQLY